MMDYNADPLKGKKEYLTMNQPYVESRPQRPVGVSILAILSLIAALFCVLNVFSYITFLSFFSSFGSSIPMYFIVYLRTRRLLRPNLS